MTFEEIRERNYVALLSKFQQGRYKWGWIYDATDDAERFAWCRFAKHKYFEVHVATLAIATYVQLSAAEQEAIYVSAQQRLTDPNLVTKIEPHMQWPDVMPGHLHFECLGIPPFHYECRCIIEPAIAGASQHGGPAHEVERLSKVPKQTIFQIKVTRE